MQNGQNGRTCRFCGFEGFKMYFACVITASSHHVSLSCHSGVSGPPTTNSLATLPLAIRVD